MENLNKTDAIRQALAILGPSTGHQLAQFTGVRLDRIGALLGADIRKNRIACGWEGKQRLYGLPGSIINEKPPVKREKPAAQLARPASNGKHLEYARQAQKLECADNFEGAAPLWLRAADYAANFENVDFYVCRAAFCEIARGKGWSYFHE